MNTERRAAFILVAFSLTLLSCRESTVIPPEVTHVPSIKGFSYTSFTSNGFALGTKRNAIGELRSQTGSEWIALSVFEYQSTATSIDIAPNSTGINPLSGAPWSTTSTEEDIRAAVIEARILNLKIMLKPHLDLYSGVWRANILPDVDGKWFASYGAMMMMYAHLASVLNIEMLCVGTELIRATQHKFSLQWKSLIASIRQEYKGNLVYAANWSGDFQYGIESPEYEQVEFWGDLDFVGVDAYYPLTESVNDGPPPIAKSLNKLLVPLQALGNISTRYGRKVILTEVGIQSARGALSRPWDYSIGGAAGSVQDMEAQDYYYRIVMSSFGAETWCDGMFWWNWESVPSANERTNYTPRNKLAAATLKRWYSGSL